MGGSSISNGFAAGVNSSAGGVMTIALFEGFIIKSLHAWKMDGRCSSYSFKCDQLYQSDDCDGFSLVQRSLTNKAGLTRTIKPDCSYPYQIKKSSTKGDDVTPGNIRKEPKNSENPRNKNTTKGA